MMLRALMLVLVVAAAAGCGHEEPYGISPDSAFPSATMTDWVTHGDQLSVIRIVDATPPRLPKEWKNSGGLIGRKVTVRIERTVWHRPHAPRRTGSFRMQAWGWTPLNDDAVMTLDGDTVTSRVDAGAPTAPAASLRGKTVAQAASVVSQAG
jgi:hypothetical protein